MKKSALKFNLVYVLITLGISSLLVAFTVFEDDVIKHVNEQLVKWTDNYPQENVYLHLDKPAYAIGDDIWFKAYITAGPQHQLSGLSGVLNVELINDRDSVKRAIKLPVAGGITWGDFELPDTLREGTYRIRAYTNWMRNFGTEYFYDKTIVVGNAVNNNIFTKTQYKYSTENGQQKVEAIINFANINGEPYAGKEVSYQVQFNDKNEAKGKGITDDKGDLHVSFINNARANTAGRIIAYVKVAEKNVVGKTIPITAMSNKVDVQFFPESGNLVYGIASKVAFKAVGADGLGKDIRGVIIDNENNEVSQLSSQHLGMGAFMLFPEQGKTYRAKITYPDGSEGIVNLPNPQKSGYVLMVSKADPQNIVVRLTASPDLASESGDNEVSLVAQCRGAMCYAAKSTLKSPVFVAKIPRSKLPSGIIQFTLFSKSGEPMNERLVFVNNPQDQLKLNISTAQATYAPREKVKVDLTSLSADDKPVAGSFSVSVVDESKVQSDEAAETSILSDILLTSDLKGYIEKPNYYFTNVNSKTESDLDVLMLTQGYRRFEWKQVLSGNLPPIVYQPEKSLQVSGFVKAGKNPVAKGKVTLFTSAGGVFFMDTLTDDKGHFAFTDLIFKDSVRFVVQARTAKDRKDVDIDLDDIKPAVVTPNPNAPDGIIDQNTNFTAYLLNSKRLFEQEVKYHIGNHIQQLKEVTITAKKEPEIKSSSNLNGAGNANQIIKGDQLTEMGCITISQCLQGRLLGVIFNGGVPYSTRSMNIPMQIIVDGMYVDPEFLDDISPADVGSIEVLRTPDYTAIYGSRGAGGVIIVNTRRGGEGGYTSVRYAPGIVTYSPKGYYKSRTFYSPQYDHPNADTHMADLRSTIFWKPNVVTDKEGKASISFFNADAKATYRVTVEGIDDNGYLGRRIYRYKVQ